MSKKRHRDIPIEVEEKPTKQEYAIAKYLKNNTPTKKTKFLSHQVNYFYANKLVDVALDSPWATGKDVVFTDRQSVVDYCDRLLKFKFFHRAKKIAITDKDLKPKDLKKKKLKEKEEKKKEEKKEKEKKALESKKEKKEENKKEEKKEKEDQEDDEEKENKEDENIEDEEDEKKKKKTKIKLDMHLEQIFVDGTDAYVWMYDPIPFWYYIVGGLCLFGAIAVCLFPLWPPEVRKGVYYLSVAAAGFLGVILGLAVVRFIVFCIIWVLTMGRHHLWLLPNLTEDVGFFQSFWPLYHYEYRGDDYKDKKKRKKKKSKEEKEEDDKISECEDQGAIDSPDTAAETDKPESDGERGVTEATGASESESENSNSQAFEIVDKEDLVQAQEAEKEKGEQSETDNDEKEKEKQADSNNDQT
ncbi:unnamed protein product, partial [Meganyctiphanes norvegica]